MDNFEWHWRPESLYKQKILFSRTFLTFRWKKFEKCLVVFSMRLCHEAELLEPGTDSKNTGSIKNQNKSKRGRHASQRKTQLLTSNHGLASHKQHPKLCSRKLENRHTSSFSLFIPNYTLIFSVTFSWKQSKTQQSYLNFMWKLD